MYKASSFNKQSYKVNEVAKILNLSTKTIRIYDANGILNAQRTVGNHRVIMREELLRYLNEKGLLIDDTVSQRRDVVYARVSSNDQKNHGDLDRQALFLVEHVPDMQNPLIMKEVGSGLNDNRKQLQELLVMVSKGEIRNVYVTYKDRLTRFGYRYLETIFRNCGTRIITVKDEAEERSVQEELVEDMMSLIASFSGKLYGMRSRKSKRKGKEKQR
jgi:excisionase family DNA binding protein